MLAFNKAKDIIHLNNTKLRNNNSLLGGNIYFRLGYFNSQIIIGF